MALCWQMRQAILNLIVTLYGVISTAFEVELCRFDLFMCKFKIEALVLINREITQQIRNASYLL